MHSTAREISAEIITVTYDVYPTAVIHFARKTLVQGQFTRYTPVGSDVPLCRSKGLDPRGAIEIGGRYRTVPAARSGGVNCQACIAEIRRDPSPLARAAQAWIRSGPNAARRQEAA